MRKEKCILTRGSFPQTFNKHCHGVVPMLSWPCRHRRRGTYPGEVFRQRQPMRESSLNTMKSELLQTAHAVESFVCISRLFSSWDPTEESLLQWNLSGTFTYLRRSRGTKTLAQIQTPWFHRVWSAFQIRCLVHLAVSTARGPVPRVKSVHSLKK